jgi:hypothetical protein
MGIVQDSLLGTRLMTKRDIFMEKVSGLAFLQKTCKRLFGGMPACGVAAALVCLQGHPGTCARVHAGNVV